MLQLRKCRRCYRNKTLCEFAYGRYTCMACEIGAYRVHELEICERERNDGYFHVRRQLGKTLCGFKSKNTPFVAQGPAALLTLKNGNDCCPLCRGKIRRMFLEEDAA